jgi:transcriptional regulator with XRE-family HTH domain
MKQPYLGKKIVELRKTKGYTQEELVEKCNINVRTLQRIESGEVTPRIYTTKIIFEALDYNVFDSQEVPSNKFKKTKDNIIRRVERLFKYMLDEINFKKHPINKFSFFLILLLSVLLVLSMFHTPNDGKDTTIIREHIENTNIKFTQWFNSGQIDSLGSLYLDTASLIFDNIFPVINNNLPYINKREGIKSYYTFFHNQGLQLVNRKSKKMVITDLIVIDIGTISLKNDSTINKNGTYLCQWHYVNGNWWIENEIFNFNK